MAKKDDYLKECVPPAKTMINDGVTQLASRVYDQNDITGYRSMGPTGKDTALAAGQSKGGRNTELAM